MLKKIIFILSEDYFTFIKEHFYTIEQTVTPHGASIELFTNSRFSQNRNIILPTTETLFITDTPETLRYLLQVHAYVIALYHEKNKHCSFPGAHYAVENIPELEYRSYEETYRRLAGLPWKILETERLLVRESTPLDIPDFYCIYQHPSITNHMEPLFENPEEEKAYLEDYIKQVYGFYGFGIWTVLLKETGKVIGRAGLNIREGYSYPELGFVIDTAFQNRGLAYEVCTAILQYAREELELDCLQAFVKSGNTASIKLLEKLGFLFDREILEGTQDYLLYRIFLHN